MKAIAVIERNGRMYGYAIGSSKVKTINELLEKLNEAFEGYQIISLKTKKQSSI